MTAELAALLYLLTLLAAWFIIRRFFAAFRKPELPNLEDIRNRLDKLNGK